MVVERLVSGTWSLAKVPYKTFALSLSLSLSLCLTLCLTLTLTLTLP